MYRVFIFLTLFVFGLSSFQFGNAMQECPVPAKSSLIYLHMEQLNALALQQNYHNTVHSPLLCLKGHDDDCKGQKCCPGEVGCCLSDQIKERHVRECGCKEANSTKCTFPPPLAVLAESKCGANGTTIITTCLREKRVSQFLPNKAGLKSKNTSYSKYEPEAGGLIEVASEVVTELAEQVLSK